MTNRPRIVTSDEWTSTRVNWLHGEKERTRERDRYYERQRALPWRRVEESYEFRGEQGIVPFEDLFGTRSQLIVYHFMYAADWEQGCQACSLFTDALDRCVVHLGARDVSVVLISGAPLNKLLAFRERMGWSLPWYSSEGSTFNVDFQATAEAADDGTVYYNYQSSPNGRTGEMPGLSVFAKDEGAIVHTYSTYGRGLEDFMLTYTLLNIVPKGRDESKLEWPMQWVRHRDGYDSIDRESEES